MSSDIVSKKRKSDEYVGEDGAPKRQKTEELPTNHGKKLVKLTLQGDHQVSFVLEADKHLILGRTSAALLKHLPSIANDSFVSREAMDVHMNSAQLVSITVLGSNPARLHRKNGETKVLSKGSCEILAAGDVFELTYNAKTNAGKYSFALSVENPSEDHQMQHEPTQTQFSAPMHASQFPSTQRMAEATQMVSLASQMPSQPIMASLKPSAPQLTPEEKELKDWIVSLSAEMEYVYESAKEQGFTSIQLFLDLIAEEKDLAELGVKLAHRKMIFRALQNMKRAASVPSIAPTTSSSTLEPEPAPEPSGITTAATQPDVAFSAAPASVDDKMDVDVHLDPEDDQLLAAKAEPVVEAPPSPPPPPPQCSICLNQTSCIICEECYQGPAPDQAQVEPKAEPAAAAAADAVEAAEVQNDVNVSVDTVEAIDEAPEPKKPKPSVPYCFLCSLKKHLQLPMDEVWKHDPTIVDQSLMAIQRNVVEEAELERESESLETAKDVLKRMEPLLATPGIATKTRLEHLVKERAELAKDARLPETLIVVMGDTGAGKSSTLNAVLGEEDILPTNGMRACTASIIEMRYNSSYAIVGTGKKYIGDIEFVTHEEWATELRALYDDCINPDTGKFLSKPDPESQAGISLAKIKLVYGYDIKFEDYPSAQHLLARKNKVTRCLGLTVRVESNRPAHFRTQIESYADSTNDTQDLAFWPLVKRISIQGPWEVLRSGAVLVDAPGVRDDNSARDNVVKSYLRSGNSIWIVSNIKRAVNDKTAKEMLGEGFRRMLLMDGLYSTITFVATHADQLNRTEMVKNLKLPRDTPLLDVAKARNAYTRTRIKADFKAGLEEMAQNANLPQDAVRSFYLPVFTVSSFDYQKCVGHFTADGPPSTFFDPEDTEIPALKRYIYEVTIRRRHEAILRYLNRTKQYMMNVEHFLSDEGTTDSDARERIYELFLESKEKLNITLETQLKELKQDLDATVSRTVLGSLPTGINAAEAQAPATAAKWGAKIVDGKRYPAGGLPWATYRATVRREGVYGSPTVGSVNFNQDLAEPIFRFISVNWDQLFGVQIGQIFKRHHDRVISAIKAANQAFGANVSALGVDQSRLAKNDQHVVTNQSARMNQRLDAIRGEITDKQRDISRTVVPAIQNEMLPAYAAASGRCGQGCFQVMKNDVSSHVEAFKSKMFKLAANNLISGLNELNQNAILQIAQMHTELVQELTLLNQSFWERPPNADKVLRGQVLRQAMNIATDIEKAIFVMSHSDLYEQQKRQQSIHERRDAEEAARAAAQIQHAAAVAAEELAEESVESFDDENEDENEDEPEDQNGEGDNSASDGANVDGEDESADGNDNEEDIPNHAAAGADAPPAPAPPGGAGCATL